jgi:hypothetical protein
MQETDTQARQAEGFDWHIHSLKPSLVQNNYIEKELIG